MDINSASQKSLQRAIDTDTLLNCWESASLRDKARLYTIGTPFTGAWLLAIPNPNLGLTLSKEEFIFSVRMWLGCHLFPSPTHLVRCVCGNIIDHFGDHVLGGGHGPLRIKRHDAFCDIIWHTLLQDNKGAIKEQRCGDNNNRPGDIFHPDFRFGKPAYFDVSVRGSLQPQYLSKAADHPGVAGEAGEIEKDEKHEDDVLAAGGLFFPLVVESLGLWTPSSLKILKVIASKSSSLNGTPLSITVSYLHQRLSIRLWAYNAQMLLSRLLDISEVVVFPN